MFRRAQRRESAHEQQVLRRRTAPTPPDELAAKRLTWPSRLVDLGGRRIPGHAEGASVCAFDRKLHRTVYGTRWATEVLQLEARPDEAASRELVGVDVELKIMQRAGSQASPRRATRL
jgi:hypothetical protein